MSVISKTVVMSSFLPDFRARAICLPQGQAQGQEEGQGALREQAPQTLSLPHSEFLEQDHIKNDLHQGSVLP